MCRRALLLVSKGTMIGLWAAVATAVTTLYRLFISRNVYRHMSKAENEMSVHQSLTKIVLSFPSSSKFHTSS